MNIFERFFVIGSFNYSFFIYLFANGLLYAFIMLIIYM